MGISDLRGAYIISSGEEVPRAAEQLGGEFFIWMNQYPFSTDDNKHQ